MNIINFRKTAKSYSTDHQRSDGCGWERRYYRAADINAIARHLGWESGDQEVHGENWTFAEMIITHGCVRPYRVTAHAALVIIRRCDYPNRVNAC